MAEYIEREALIKHIENRFGEISTPFGVKEIKNFPKADVVEVVRCKECKHWGGVIYGYRCRHFSGMYTHTSTAENDFCNHGEKKGRCWGMTYEEAKQAMQFFKEKLYNGIFGDKIGVFDVAISALEKQIPKKPNIHGYEDGREINTISYTCPVCNKHIGRENFCKHCGQALDRSDRMKIYEFSSFFTKDKLFTVTAIEVEEKPKSYVGDGIQITKDKINVLRPQFGNQMFRLDDDPKEYIEAVVKHQSEKFEEYTARLKKATTEFCDWYKLLKEETGDKNAG